MEVNLEWLASPEAWMALVARIGLLLSITWVMSLSSTLFSVLDNALSGRDLILIGGGLFLLAKSTHEIHSSLKGEQQGGAIKHAGFISVIAQIMVIALGVMMLAAGSIARFVDTHPTLKMLALSFLVLLIFTLIAEGIEVHIPKGYIYFAMAFSFGVEILNLRAKKRLKAKAVRLHNPRKAKLKAEFAEQGADYGKE
ncbi:TerC family protein [Corallincola platygyrae]|uniref:TerC family protein n=1 Tax=Corallincola platygyrae TaxID=1193278 RepID=A0ABW4XP71_9GAMM